jgi:hypothetical protein
VNFTAMAVTDAKRMTSILSLRAITSAAHNF